MFFLNEKGGGEEEEDRPLATGRWLF